MLYNFIVKVFLDGGSIPPTSTNLDADYNKLMEGSATPQVNNMGVTRFRQENGNYKTAPRRMMARLSIIQTITANDYDLALAA